MTRVRLCLLVFCLAMFACSNRAPRMRAFDELVFIDHQNLRYIADSARIAFQANEARKNMAQAARLGVDTYLFFAKETFDAMLNIDSPMPGIGSIGAQAFAPNGEHRRVGAYLRCALGELLQYARTKQLRVFYHSNQFIFKENVLKVIKPAVWGTSICPGRQMTWSIYRQKLGEFFALFPDLAGLQITGDETQASVLECRCDSCRHLGFVERVNRLTTETARVCAGYGKEVQMRTWGRMGELTAESGPAHMGDGLPNHVFFSIKNTQGDFHLPNAMDEGFIRAADAKRIIVEFDAWREYEGHNYFPCYMGDIWAPRFKLLQQLGIKRIAVRLNWNSNINPIFAAPWGNLVNIYTFLKLAENPQRSPDDILRSFIRENYPQACQEKAFALYKFTSAFQKTMYYFQGHYSANHSRVQDDDALKVLSALQKTGEFTSAEHFAGKRAQIERAGEEAERLVQAIAPHVPAAWGQGLLQGIIVEQTIARANLIKMEAWFWKKQNNENEYRQVLEQLRQEQRTWQDQYPDSFHEMDGAEMLTDL